MTEVEADWANQVRAIAANEVSSCISAKQTILEEHSASFRWLMASMLAINAGGLLQVGGLSTVLPAHKLLAAMAFLVGILSALAIAWLGQIAARKMIGPLAEAIAFWTITSATGEFDEEHHDEVIAKIQASVKEGKKSRVAGWLSTLAFIVGVTSILTGNMDPESLGAKAENVSQANPTETISAAPPRTPGDIDVAQHPKMTEIEAAPEKAIE